MPTPLPKHPNLDYLKKQAKELLKAHRSGTRGVCAALEQYLPRFALNAEDQILAANISLHDAQQVIARQYGFCNWAALRQEVTQRLATPAPPKPKQTKPPKLSEVDIKLRRHIEALGFSTVGGYRVWCHQQGLGSTLDKSDAQLAAERERARQLGGNLEPQVSRTYRRGQAEAIQKAYASGPDPDRPGDWLGHLFAVTPDPDERQALYKLLLQVEKYTLIRWETAAPLAPHYRNWRRPIEQFFPKGLARAEQLIELTRYLLGQDKVVVMHNPALNRALEESAAKRAALAAKTHQVLTGAQIQSFKERGYVRLPKAFPSEAALEMQDFMWFELNRLHGFERDDPSTWKIAGRHSSKIQPGDLKLNSSKDNPVYNAIGSQRLLGAYAQLTGRWGAGLKQSWGGFLISFPDADEQPWQVRANHWHIDFSPRPGQYTLIPFGLRVFTFFSQVEPEGGGTLVVEGSHRLALKFYQSLSPLDLELKKSTLDNRFAQSNPWLAELAGKAPDQGDRTRRFMEEGTTIDDVAVKVVELTGEPGDAILCHPALYHCRSYNRSKLPRFMRS